MKVGQKIMYVKKSELIFLKANMLVNDRVQVILLRTHQMIKTC